MTVRMSLKQCLRLYDVLVYNILFDAISFKPSKDDPRAFLRKEPEHPRAKGSCRIATPTTYNTYKSIHTDNKNARPQPPPSYSCHICCGRRAHTYDAHKIIRCVAFH